MNKNLNLSENLIESHSFNITPERAKVSLHLLKIFFDTF